MSFPLGPIAHLRSGLLMTQVALVPIYRYRQYSSDFIANFQNRRKLDLGRTDFVWPVEVSKSILDYHQLDERMTSYTIVQLVHISRCFSESDEIEKRSERFECMIEIHRKFCSFIESAVTIIKMRFEPSLFYSKTDKSLHYHDTKE